MAKRITRRITRPIVVQKGPVQTFRVTMFKANPSSTTGYTSSAQGGPGSGTMTRDIWSFGNLSFPTLSNQSVFNGII